MKNTPLLIASKYGHILIVKYLLEYGADINLINAYQKNVYEMADDAIELASITFTKQHKGSPQKVRESAQQEVI